MQGSSGTFHIKDVDGYSFDLTYSYEPSRALSKAIMVGDAQMAHVKVEALYRLRIVNTTPGRTLSFKPTRADWPATFALYAWWVSPNVICDGKVGPNPGFWCGVELAHFHVDQDIAPGASVELAAIPGFSDAKRGDAGFIVPEVSEVLPARDGLASPDDLAITYEGFDGWRFLGSCPNRGMPASPGPEMRKSGFTNKTPIASRSGICQVFMDRSIPQTEDFIASDEGYTIVN